MMCARALPRSAGNGPAQTPTRRRADDRDSLGQLRTFFGCNAEHFTITYNIHHEAFERRAAGPEAAEDD